MTERTESEPSRALRDERHSARLEHRDVLRESALDAVRESNVVPIQRHAGMTSQASSPTPTARSCARTRNGGRLRAWAARLLEPSGITLDGPGPMDIRVHDQRLFARVFAQGSLGFGEAYVEGWWDSDDLAGCLTRLLASRVDTRIASPYTRWLRWRFSLLNLQRGARAWTVGRRHYDLGNDLFAAMLGERLVYSCGYWNGAKSLDAAQRAKLDLCFRKLRLEPGMRILDIGCGWGEALKYAAECYDVRGVGVTISAEQAEYARRLCAGLPVEIRLADYRTLSESFDRIFSIGMFEHVGTRNYATYFEVADRCLKRDGLFLLHTIGTQEHPSTPDPWIEKYIFPNSAIPALSDLVEAFRCRFVLEDWHNFGLDYDRTLEAWYHNFERAWPQLRACYGEEFRRLWHYYLAASAASFRTRRNQLWQLVLAPQERNVAYRGVR